MTEQVNQVEAIAESPAVNENDAVVAHEHLRYSLESRDGGYATLMMNTYMGELLNQMKEDMQLTDDQFNILNRGLGNTWSRMNGVVSAALEYTEMFQYHVVENRRLNGPVLFKMNDLAAKMYRNALFVDPRVTARRPEVGDADPRWTHCPLPYERLVADQTKIGTVRIPVKADTGLETIHGFYELYVEPVENGNDVTTTLGAIRSKEHYHIPNSVYRWIEVSEQVVRDKWRIGQDVVPHPVPETPLGSPLVKVENNEAEQKD